MRHTTLAGPLGTYLLGAVLLVGASAVLAQPTPFGRVRCVATNNGRAARAEIGVDGGPMVNCRRGLPLAEGGHWLTIGLSDAIWAETRRWVTVTADETLTVPVELETGELLLMTQRASQPVPATGQLWSQGAVRARLRPGAPARVQPGIYVVDVESSGATRRFSPVHVTAGERTVLFWQLPQTGQPGD